MVEYVIIVDIVYLFYIHRCYPVTYILTKLAPWILGKQFSLKKRFTVVNETSILTTILYPDIVVKKVLYNKIWTIKIKCSAQCTGHYSIKSKKTWPCLVSLNVLEYKKLMQTDTDKALTPTYRWIIWLQKLLKHLDMKYLKVINLPTRFGENF